MRIGLNRLFGRCAFLAQLHVRPIHCLPEIFRVNAGNRAYSTVLGTIIGGLLHQDRHLPRNLLQTQNSEHGVGRRKLVQHDIGERFVQAAQIVRIEFALTRVT